MSESHRKRPDDVPTLRRDAGDRGLLRNVTRLLTQHRKLRRLEVDPLRQDLVSSGHTVSYLRHLVRGNEQLRPRTPAESGALEAGPRPPVLLIHGFLGTRGSMFVLEQRLISDGFDVISLNLGVVNTRDIRTSALLIHKKVEQIVERLASQHPSHDRRAMRRIDIVGHSMGGLIGLYYVKRLGGASMVRRLVQLGTPNHGTWMALLGVATLGLWSSSSWQLLPGSPFLSELQTGPLPNQTEVYSICAERDWVCPPDATQIEGAHTIRVPLGHASLVVSEEVYRKVLWALRKEDSPR